MDLPVITDLDGAKSVKEKDNQFVVIVQNQTTGVAITISGLSQVPKAKGIRWTMGWVMKRQEQDLVISYSYRYICV